MENDEMLLEQDPGQQGEELELETQGEEQPTEEAQGGDPLDEIQDAETLRAEAKKQRAIAQRLAKKPTEKQPEKPVVQPKVESSDYLKKSDFELANQKKAIRLATTVSGDEPDQVRETKEDMLANWEQVRQFYTPRRGKATAEDILEDIKDAYVLFNARRPKKETSDTTDLVATKATGTGQAPATKEKKQEPKNFNLPTKPEDWYPTKS